MDIDDSNFDLAPPEEDEVTASARVRAHVAAFRLKAISVALEYERWLQDTQQAASYANFREGFNYVGEDCAKIYQAVTRIRKTAAC
ncbi:hypothetical protein ACYPKM_04980 [Pseudomonas aeruginosa]